MRLSPIAYIYWGNIARCIGFRLKYARRERSHPDGGRSLRLIYNLRSIARDDTMWKRINVNRRENNKWWTWPERERKSSNKISANVTESAVLRQVMHLIVLSPQAIEFFSTIHMQTNRLKSWEQTWQKIYVGIIIVKFACALAIKCKFVLEKFLSSVASRSCFISLRREDDVQR